MDATLTAPPARTIFGWFPVFWSHVLFPGSAPQPERLSLWSLLWLILIPGAILYPSLSFALFEPDETRYAQIPREMLQRQEIVVPYLHNEPYLDKPPLFYWLVMTSYTVFGVGPGSARLVPALAVHGTIFLVYLFGRRWLGEKPAIWGALLLSLAPGFAGMARLLLLDGLLTFLVTLTVFSAFEAVRGEQFRRGWWLLSAFACGLGMLTKGPIAEVLLAVPLGLHIWLTGRCTMRRRDVALYLAVVLAVAVPWYVAVAIRQPDFLRYFFWEQNVQRFLDPFDHPRGVFFYIPIVLLGLLPTTLWLWPSLKFLTGTATASQRPPALGFLLLASGWCLLFFTLSGCKLPTYILPAFPPLMLVVGCVLHHTGTLAKTHFRGCVAVMGCLVVLAHQTLLPWYAEYRSPVRQLEPLAPYCNDPQASVVSYPRPCHAVAFAFDRPDLPNYRSKDIEELRTLVRTQKRTIILCTHRHSVEGLRQLLPPEVQIVYTERFALPPVPGLPERYQAKARNGMGETALGLCDLVVVECPHPAERPSSTSLSGAEAAETSGSASRRR